MKILYNSNPDINNVCKKYLGKNVWIKFQYHNPNTGVSSLVYLRLLQRREAFNDIECNVICANEGDIRSYPESVLRACAYNISIYDPDGEYLTPVFPLDIITNAELFGRFEGSVTLDDLIGSDILIKVTMCMFGGGTRNPFLQIPPIVCNPLFIHVIEKDGFKIKYKAIFEEDIDEIFDHMEFFTSDTVYYEIDNFLHSGWTSTATIDSFHIVQPEKVYTLSEIVEEFNQCELIPDNDDYDDEDWENDEE